MNYFSIYNNIIDSAKGRCVAVYTENHHIIPKCMGGSDDYSNIIKLTAREHYICHWLLYKHYKTKKLAYAWNCMCMNSSGNRYSSRTFAYAREAWSVAIKEINTGRVVSDATRRKQSAARTGSVPWNKGMTLDKSPTKKNIEYGLNPKKCAVCAETISFSMRNRSKYCSVICRNSDWKSWGIAGNTKPNKTSFKKGHVVSDQAKAKLSAALTGFKRPTGNCPNCGKFGALSLLKRWHFDNCRAA